VGIETQDGGPAATALRNEAVALLQELLRLNTVNPPGNETEAAELLREHLEAAGLACELYARTPERANLVARLPGRGEGPSLLLLSHTDTVVADPSEWTVDPWSGDVRDGCVWGRGALDMKGHVAAAATAIAALAREGFEPAGDLVFAATADEEVGENYGLSWLCREHPDAVRADYCVNEGGGDRVVVDGQPVYLCSVAEKMSAPFRLRVHGRSGHASMPGIADNALVRAAGLLQRLVAFAEPPRLTAETEAVLAALGRVPEPEELERSLESLSADTRAMVEPMLGVAVSPTMISASERVNVVPGRCDIVCDCRLLPGVSPGFTDSHYLREAFGTVAYGFFPLQAMDSSLAARLVHSADERIAVDDLDLGVQFLLHVARTLGR
jgi:acetylornithine deacetylase/succinyl-diaminopimelate desuccinylase-like protein